ncbi:phosphate signaling complex protein PhoU [Corynebacterium sputi]|uniref:phosphate signaling complex protein PhoU n=1 Tax=Corynebacterium sputi TaxID=489915 RepID=UPI0003FE41D7|nr:phosphate signaling complex protein PhoU [Corynebacterium sputi]
MRTVYREQMDNLAHDLLLMCDQIHDMNRKASKALFDADIAAAETVLGSVDKLDELRERSETRAIELLALEGPVAGDLRQIISGIYIVEDMARMGALSVHIAKTARRRHPDKAVPADTEGYFREMAKVCDSIVTHTREILTTYDVEMALTMAQEDDSIDDIHQHLFSLTTSDTWAHSSKVTVDVTLLSRYYERFADHAVEVAARVVYLATGYKPGEYLGRIEGQEELDQLRTRISNLERHFDN